MKEKCIIRCDFINVGTTAKYGKHQPGFVAGAHVDGTVPAVTARDGGVFGNGISSGVIRVCNTKANLSQGHKREILAFGLADISNVTVNGVRYSGVLRVLANTNLGIMELCDAA